MSKCSVTAGSDGTFIIRLPKRNMESFEEKKVAVNFSFPNVGNLCMYVYFLTTPSLGGGSFQGQHEQTGEKYCE